MNINNVTFGRRWTQVGLSALMVATVVGCSSQPKYPSQYPYDSSQSTYPSYPVVNNRQSIPSHYVVRRGDNVSQIAERFGVSYRVIGRLNNLDSDYTIYPGQRLKLPQAGYRPNYATSNNHPSYGYQLQSYGAKKPSSNTVYQLQYGFEPFDSKTYQFPTKNRLIRNFDIQNDNLGVWFSGRRGDPVFASQSGVVMYAGNGIPEYGNLILISHGPDYVTAYAHNDRLFVRENDVIEQGQQIAAMGNTGTSSNNRVALEFQMRYKGKAVDPQYYLVK